MLLWNKEWLRLSRHRGRDVARWLLRIQGSGGTLPFASCKFCGGPREVEVRGLPSWQRGSVGDDEFVHEVGLEDGTVQVKLVGVFKFRHPESAEADSGEFNVRIRERLRQEVHESSEPPGGEQLLRGGRKVVEGVRVPRSDEWVDVGDVLVYHVGEVSDL